MIAPSCRKEAVSMTKANRTMDMMMRRHMMMCLSLLESVSE